MCPRRLTTMPYKKSMLESAVKAVMAGTFTAKQSASVYGVPVGTISTQLRRKGYSGRTKRENGNLTQVDQQALEWLQLMSEIGCFSLKNQLGEILREVFERLCLRDKLTAKMSSQTLTLKFLQRNPNVPSSFIESKEAGTNLTAAHIDEWIAKQKEHILSTYNLHISEFLVDSNAGNVFCCFEVGSVFPSIKNMFSRLIYKPKLDGPLLLTLYCCLCADGTFLKPVAVLKSEEVSQTTMDNAKLDFHILYSKHGKMDCEAAMLWLQLIDEEMEPKKEDKPFMIYLDQFIRPLSLATLDFCRQHEMILYYLPGHYPHVKLPFGMDVFYNLNGEYDSILASDDAKHHTSSTDLTLTLLVDAWKQMLAANATTTEFRDFGILPLDPAALKSIVETIVPITMSSSEGLSDNMEIEHSSRDAAAVPQTPNFENAERASKNSHRLVPSPHCEESSTAKRASRTAVRSYKESSDTDEQLQLTSVKERPLVSLQSADTATDIVSQKPNIKIKIKRSNQTSNDFCVESRPNSENCTQLMQSLEQPVPADRPLDSNTSSMPCSHCDRERQKALKSGVVEGLVYALKRIESSLRADTLHLYKTRYLSPYLRDHRPTEPSFLMWCEIMKCLEIGPEAVHQDYLISRNLHETHSFISSKQNDTICTKSILPQAPRIPYTKSSQGLNAANEHYASKQLVHSNQGNFGAQSASERKCHSWPTDLQSPVQRPVASRVSEVPVSDKQRVCMVDLDNNAASAGISNVLYSTADHHSRSSVTKHQVEVDNLQMPEDPPVRRLPEYPGMYNYFQGKLNCSEAILAQQSAGNHRNLTGNSLLQGSVERELTAAECSPHSLPESQCPPASHYSSQHLLQCGQETMQYEQHLPNFEARASLQSPKHHEICVQRTSYEPSQNPHPPGMQQALHLEAQNFQSKQSFLSPQQQIRFSSFPSHQQQHKQTEVVGVRPSAQEHKAHQTPGAFEPGQLPVSRKGAEDSNAGFHTYCSPYKQTSTPKSAAMALSGQHMLSSSGRDGSNPQASVMALSVEQNDPSSHPAAKIDQYGMQQSYVERIPMAVHSSSLGLRYGACAPSAYGVEAPVRDGGGPMAGLGSKALPAAPHRAVQFPAAPAAAEAWSQNSAVPMSVPRSVWVCPPNDSVSHRVKAYDFTSGVCSTVLQQQQQQQQSVISYQNYLAATSCLSQSGVVLPVTAAEELPKTASYTNL